MEQVSSYLIKMLPCLFIVLPVYLLFRRFYLLKRNGIHSSTISREFSLLFFTIYLTGLASLTIVPDFKITNQSITPIEIGYNQERINLVPLNKINETQIIVENGNPSYLFFEVCGNIGAFIPIGFLLPFLWRYFAKAVRTIFFCFLISFTIETIQLVLPRGTDVDDLLMNTLGGVVGFFTFIIVKKKPWKHLANFVTVHGMLKKNELSNWNR